MAETPALAFTVHIRPEAQVKAEALREAADALYSDEGPDHPLSTATWLRKRADTLAAHHDTRPGREQIETWVREAVGALQAATTINERMFATGQVEGLNLGNHDRLTREADAVLALLGQARTVDRKPDEGRHHNARP